MIRNWLQMMIIFVASGIRNAEIFRKADTDIGLIQAIGGDVNQRGLHALRPRPGKDPPVEEEEEEEAMPEVKPGNLTCYSCKLDFRKRDYESDHPCLGRHNGLNVSDNFLVACGPNDVFCRAERTEVNGVLIILRRECTDICYYGCRPKGFGINFESCAQCCNTHGCNHMYPASHAPPTIPNILSYVATYLITLGALMAVPNQYL